MEITQAQWVIALIGFAGGGAVGALITQFVTTWRGRKQPIGLQLQTNAVFTATPEPDEFGAVTRLVVEQDGARHVYDNLHSLEVTVQNLGNADYSKFVFGLTFPEDQSIVRMMDEAPSRLHKADAKAPITEGVVGSNIDIHLEPFNRGDTYRIVFQVHIDGTQPLTLPEVSCAAPIRFIQPVNTAALVNEVFAATIIKMIAR